MKSYFAKLAARATLANAPAPKSVNARRAHDPFEATVTSPDTTHHSTVWPTSPSSDRLPAERNAVSESSSKTTELRPQTESTVTPTPKSSTIVAPPSTEPEQPITRATKESELPPRDLFETRKVTHVEPQQISPEAHTSPRLVPTTPSKETEVSQSSHDDEMTDRLVNIESEQAVLLRKADSFIASLFERRSSKREQAESEEDHSQQHATKSERPIQTATRLQPPTPQARVSEPTDEAPSLVIGKLSVEIVPAPTPVVTPQRQVVVIGGGRRTRAGVPSAHRFGFSRF